MPGCLKPIPFVPDLLTISSEDFLGRFFFCFCLDVLAFKERLKLFANFIVMDVEFWNFEEGDDSLNHFLYHLGYLLGHPIIWTLLV